MLCQDIRAAQPDGPSEFVLCRNLVLTYFDPGLQGRALADIAARMRPGAALVVDKDEALPAAAALEPSPAGLRRLLEARAILTEGSLACGTVAHRCRLRPQFREANLGRPRGSSLDGGRRAAH